MTGTQSGVVNMGNVDLYSCITSFGSKSVIPRMEARATSCMIVVYFGALSHCKHENHFVLLLLLMCVIFKQY